MFEQTIEIDLNNIKSIDKPFFSGELRVNLPKVGWLQNILLHPPTSFEWHEIKVEKVEVNTERLRMVGIPESLIGIQVADLPNRQLHQDFFLIRPLNSEVTSSSILFPYHLYFDATRIYDWRPDKDVSDGLELMHITIKKQEKPTTPILTDVVNVRLVFKPSMARPVLKFSPTTDADTILADGAKQIYLGELEIQNDSVATFAHPITDELVNMKVSGLDGAVVKIGKEISIGSDYIDKEAAIKHDKIHIKKLPGKSRVLVPVYLDLESAVDSDKEEDALHFSMQMEGVEAVQYNVKLGAIKKKPLPPNPVCQFQPETQLVKNGINFLFQPKEKLGTILISNPSKGESILPYKGNIEISTSKDDALVKIESRGSQVSIQGGSYATIEAVEPDGSVKFDVFLILEQMNAPVAKQGFDLTILLDGEVAVVQQFSINEYVSLTDLHFEVLHATTTTEIKDGKRKKKISYERPDALIWNPKLKSGAFRNCFSILFSNNQKTTGPGGVVLGNFRWEIGEVDAIEAVKKEKPQDWLEMSMSREDEPTTPSIPISKCDGRESWLISDGEKGFQLDIAFKGNKLINILGDQVELICNLKFDYFNSKWDAERLSNLEYRRRILNNEGSTYEIQVRFNIEKDPGKEWLAIDFGTSATVVAFDSGDGGGDKLKLVNLQEVLKEYLGTSFRRENVDEFGTEFLSSTMLLKDGLKLNAPDYSENLLLVSPVKGQFEASPHRRIPYLKALVGVSDLLEANPSLKGMPYIDDEGNKQVCDEHNPLPIQQILQAAYFTLLQHFALTSKTVRHTGNSEVGRLVLTYPNTYSPLHIEIIKELLTKHPVLGSFLRPKYLRFYSESDSVACYYIDKWRQFNKRRPNAEETFKSKRQPEYVLVYDIGAGTLDITWLRIEQLESKREKVVILGRLGKNVAGNYFDHELAHIFADLYARPIGGKGGERGYFTYDPFDDGSKFKYKDFIKYDFKPRLARIENPVADKFIEILPIDGLFAERFHADCQEVFDHPRFQALMQENTAEVLGHFFQLFSPNPTEAKNNRIDTVIVSGRTGQFSCLRKKLSEVLKELTGAKDNEEPFIVGVDELFAEGEEEKKAELFKSVVVQGALRLAAHYGPQKKPDLEFSNANERLMARYGVLFGDAFKDSQPWQFVELLGPPSLPESAPSGSISGGRQHYFNSGKKQIDIRSARQVYFVQSFLPPSCDSDERYYPLDGMFNTEYTTIIQVLDKEVELQGYELLEVSLVITSDPRMTLSIADGENPRHKLCTVDSRHALHNPLTKSELYKKSMWPYADE